MDRTVERDDRKALGGERERDRQRTTSRDSNSGRREHSCAVCRRTNHEAIGTDKQGFLKRINQICPWSFTILLIYMTFPNLEIPSSYLQVSKIFQRKKKLERDQMKKLNKYLEF